MEIELRFFANFRDVVGQKTITREYDDSAAVGDVLRSLREEYPDMDLFEDEDTLREFLTVMRNGNDVTHADGLETELSEGDTVSVFPPVAGG